MKITSISIQHKHTLANGVVLQTAARFQSVKMWSVGWKTNKHRGEENIWFGIFSTIRNCFKLVKLEDAG